MARDYKATTTRPRRKPAPPRTAGWVWLLAGLVPGLFIALMVYLGGYTPGRHAVAMAVTDVSVPARVDAVAVRRTGEAPAPSAASTESEPGASQDDAAQDGVPPAAIRPVRALKSVPPVTGVKPRFDFYTVLPEMEVAVPEREISGVTRAGVAQVEKPGTYLLQAGSFRRMDEADHLKANLALIGVDATIQTVTVNNKDTWHRVHIGPYRDLAQLNQVRARLKQNRVDAVLLKIRT